MTKAEQIKALYRSNFSAFLRFAFRELNPKTELVDTWHIDVLADYLERVAKGEITRLIINLPPRCLKSLAASIALPVWMHGRNPELKIMSIAGSRELAGDFERATEELLKSQRCRALFPHLKAEGRGGNLYLPHGGQRISGVVGGILVGRGADMIVVDDPIAPSRVHDEPRRRAVNKWFDAEVIPRLNDKNKGRVVVVMQRLHHEDLSGHLLSGEQPWVHLNLPAIATENEEWKLSRGGVITRQRGLPLAPKIDSWAPLYKRMLDIGAYNFSAQYQQKPYVHMNDEETRGGWFGSPISLASLWALCARCPKRRFWLTSCLGSVIGIRPCRSVECRAKNGSDFRSGLQIINGACSKIRMLSGVGLRMKPLCLPSTAPGQTITDRSILPRIDAVSC